jgi:NitT/TauT family transport system permease protein
VRKRTGKFHASAAARILAAALALCVWHIAALAVGNDLLLVTPLAVARRLCELVVTADFWATLGATFVRIVGGFLLALALASVLAGLSAAVPMIETLLRPYVAVIKSVPVASFIVMALLWLSSRRLALFIAFLMVFPILYTNILQGLRAADPELLEMAKIFRLPPGRRVRCIYLPALRAPLLAGCRTALGMCWKAGVAAEVIGVSAGSIGGKLYDAKAYLEIADLFAWTVVIVAVSAAFERLFLFALRKALDASERSIG